MDPKALMLPPDDAKPADPVQAAFDALRAAVDEAERNIMTNGSTDEETPAEEKAPGEEAE